MIGELIGADGSCVVIGGVNQLPLSVVADVAGRRGVFQPAGQELSCLVKKRQPTLFSLSVDGQNQSRFGLGQVGGLGGVSQWLKVAKFPCFSVKGAGKELSALPFAISTNQQCF